MVGQNTEKSPVRLDETYCHLDSSGKSSANADVKNLQRSKIIIIIMIIVMINNILPKKKIRSCIFRRYHKKNVGVKSQ